MNAISTKNLVKRYGARAALNDLSLDIPRYAMFGLVGANGAGKTTWMMSVAGFLRLTSGCINLLGEGPFDAAVHRGRLAILPQDSELPLESRVLELLTHYGVMQGLKRQEATRSAISMLGEVNLADRANATIRSLSHGMRKRVMIAQCFIGYPEVVLLDEPLSGLDPHETANMRNFLKKRQGEQTVVISSHNLNDIEIICDHIAFIAHGQTAHTGLLSEMIGQSSLLVYQLFELPQEFDKLQEKAAQFKLELDESQLQLLCYYDSSECSAQMVNRIILPELIATCGVLAVTRGTNLEQTYLGRIKTAQTLE